MTKKKVKTECLITLKVEEETKIAVEQHRIAAENDQYKSIFGTDLPLSISSNDFKKMYEEFSFDGMRNDNMSHESRDIKNDDFDTHLNNYFTIACDQSLLGQKFSEDFFTSIAEA